MTILNQSEILILGLISSKVNPKYSRHKNTLESLLKKKLITITNSMEMFFSLTLKGKWIIFNYYCEHKVNDYQSILPLSRNSS